MTEVTPAGRVARLAMYALCVVMASSGPGFLALSLLLHADLWAGLLIGALLTLILVPLGVAMWSDVRSTARRMRRLTAAGVPATAEVIAVRPTTYDSNTRVELRLWINAPGVEPFEASHTRDGGSRLEVGTTLGAVVDPDGRLYAVV
ncbi:hypothetical protein [Aeromicrobium ginsengisoli]|uniref:Uncharacterized protein n=1 Tax=Aeromicrobium ginsengisoli TaxID=363867 RepID=A0A5M4FAV1_9ACTN|nr:hypothetical protein [Aeromicrobium ginsengisoli]KAA1395397.1 hypothetical protein ESP70_014665 [Aeromicrobium ginsengisoli]